MGALTGEVGRSSRLLEPRAVTPIPLLLLGGTTEAASLARVLVRDGRVSLLTSLAGRTRHPGPVPGAVRVGGFGGAGGLGCYLCEKRVGLLVDATHPYAAVISQHAAEACRRTGIERVQLLRPPWRPRPGDHWIPAESARAAAGKVGADQRVLLTTGRRDLSEYATVGHAWFLIRLVEPVESALLPAHSEVRLARGPFDVESEMRLLREHRIDVLVSKNSGGEGTYAKIAAARHLRIPVIMLDRPLAPRGPVVTDVAGAVAWIEERLHAPAGAT